MSQPRDTPCLRCPGEFFRGKKGLSLHNTWHQKQDAKLINQAAQAEEPDVSISRNFSELLMMWKKTVRLAPFVPQAARLSVTDSLTKLVNVCVRDNNFDSWKKLLSFAYCVFCLPPRKGEKVGSLATIIKNNVLSFEAGNLTPSYTSDAPERRPTTGKFCTKRFEAKMRDFDMKGAVRILSFDDSIADNCAETLEILQAKHPLPRHKVVLPLNDPAIAANVQEVTELEIHEAVQTFPKGSAGGPDGLRPQHVRNLLGNLEADSQKKLAIALAALATLVVRGNVNAEIVPHFFGATLIALKKKDGGIRPIAVRCTFRRTPAKILVGSVQEATGNILRPIQLGYGTPGEAEGVVHAARFFLNRNSTTPRVFVKLDFRNAFNTVSRDKMLQAVKEFSPECYPYFWQAYNSPSLLLYDGCSILSVEGLQQGCPGGPFAFCAVSHPLFKSLQSEFNVSFLDGVALGGVPATVLADIETVKSWEDSHGLELNPKKCELYIMDCSEEEREKIAKMFSIALPGIQILSRENLDLLGSPLTDEAIPAALEEKTEAVELLSSRLHLVQPHQALYVLKHCTSIPKLMYTLRTNPTYKHPDKLRAFDEVLRKSLQKITNTALNDFTWLQATLPVKKGGLGIRLTEELALPAYLASAFSVSALTTAIVHDYEIYAATSAACLLWKSITFSEELPFEGNLHIQREWDHLVIERQFLDVQEHLADDKRNKARFSAVCLPESSAWLNAFPSPVFGNMLDPDSLRISVALRLGTTVVQEHKCVCGKMVDILGHHGLSCKNSAGRHSRHSAVNDVICRALISAKSPAKREPPGVDRGDGKRPDGMTQQPWTNGQYLVWDATCVDTLAASYLNNSANNPGSTASHAEDNKVYKYRNLPALYLFVPLAFETFGPWGKSAKRLVAEIGKRIFNETGERRAHEFLRQRISIEMQRGNAASVLGTMPPMKGLEGIFCLLSNRK